MAESLNGFDVTTSLDTELSERLYVAGTVALPPILAVATLVYSQPKRVITGG